MMKAIQGMKPTSARLENTPSALASTQLKCDP